MIEEIRIIKGPRGLFISFPARRQSDGTYRDIAFPANAGTRRMIEQAILAEYEKLVGKEESGSSSRSAADRLKALEQLKNDSLITEEEYNTGRKEILGEL